MRADLGSETEMSLSQALSRARADERSPGSDFLMSAYPLTSRIVSQLEAAHGFQSRGTVVLGELKRETIGGILRALRGVRCRTLWLVVSEHNFQPYLPFLLLLAALTRARSIRVTDFAGTTYAAGRPRILLREPVRLLLGSARGFASLLRVRRVLDEILMNPPAKAGPIPERPSIAYLKTNLWFGVQAGGSIGHVAGVVNGFAKLGCVIEVFAAEQLPMIDPAVKQSYVASSAISGLPLELNGYQFHEIFTASLEPKLKRWSPDLIYQRNCLANCAGVVLSRKLGLPLVIEYNGSEVWVSRHWGTPLRFSDVASKVEEANLRHAHLIVVVSEVLREELIGRGIPAERILCYPNCIDPAIFDPGRFSAEQTTALRERYGIDADAVVCTFLGTFGPWHGSDVLAEAIRDLARTRFEWLRARRVHFMLVGDGQLMPKVRKILDGVPPGLVSLTGLVQQDEAALHLATSDILVSPHVPNPDGTRFFGSPTKLFEYMGMGRAIVASDLDQIGAVLSNSWHVGKRDTAQSLDQLRESAALLITPGSKEELTRAIEFLVDVPEARAVLGGNARSSVLRKYTWERHVSAIVSKLQSLV